MPLNPVFDRHVYEGITIGRMLLNYGEIELLIGMLLGNALESQDTALRTMFRIIGESARVSAADALMRETYKRAGLEAEYADMIGAVRWCIRARNQYAHCHWGDDERAPGIFFTELGEPAKATEGFEYWWRHVDIDLLTEQLAHFEYAGDCLAYVNFEFLHRRGKSKPHNAQMPPKRQQPNLHNPPELHIPPWLTEDERRRHIERTRAETASDHSLLSQPKPKKPSSRERRETAMKAKR
ncbi:MAG TPA: hypothetical protein VMA53_17455 [Stellaceae bacterium]|nr:hypothetical protein [Stellaceae bacterium]